MSCFTFQINQLGPLGKNIKEIIIQSEQFIVFMDESDTIQWYTESYTFHKDFGEIQNKVSDWESKADNLFNKKDSYSIKCVLAEAYARILDDKNIDFARDIIDRAIVRIEKQGSEILKQSYAFSSFGATIIILILILVSKCFKKDILEIFDVDTYEIWMTTLAGGIGAYIFATLRLKKYKPEIVISKRVHIWDGILRIFYGLVAGFLISIAIKSNLVLGFLNKIDKSIYVTMFMGIIAGASEILIPNLIRQIEGKSNRIN